MLDFNAYLAAQYLTREAVNEAPSGAMVRPDDVTMTRRPGGISTRHWRSLSLRHLADVIAAAASGHAGSAMRTASVHGGCCL